VIFRSAPQRRKEQDIKNVTSVNFNLIIVVVFNSLVFKFGNSGK
jgi:hypothetical protein